MSNLQIIEALTGIVYKQNEIIHAQAEALAQVGAGWRSMRRGQDRQRERPDRPAFGR